MAQNRVSMDVPDATELLPGLEQEWAGLGGGSGMADYFALENVAGALLHLVGLGAGMGGLLGLIRGGAVKVLPVRRKILEGG